VINPWDEYAVETALLQQEALGGEVIVVTIGPESALEVLRFALAMGCSQAYLVSDPALAHADSRMIARTLAAAIQKIGAVDLALFGRQAIDSDTGVTSAQTARVLGWPSLTLVSTIQTLEPAASLIRVERNTEEGRQTVSARLPAVVSVVKDIAEPRYPSFMGIRKASRVEIPAWSLEDLNLTPVAPVVTWPEVFNPPQREVVTEMLSGAPQAVAVQLVEKLMAEKVL
jgi:electron transfer flavoprotein beta subunit